MELMKIPRKYTPGYKAPVEGPFDSRRLRNRVRQIEMAKEQITKHLSEPLAGRTAFHLHKWNRMNGQQKKIFVFRAMALGFMSPCGNLYKP